MSRKLLIFSVSVGEGHNQVCRALQEEWEEHGGEAEIIDVFSLVDTETASRLKTAYFICIKKFPLLWDGVYKMTDLQRIGEFIQPLLKFWWGKQLQFLSDKECTCIAAVHPLATQVASLMLQQTEPRNIPLYSVITDFSTHKLSLTSCVSGVFLSEKEEAAELQMAYPHCRFYPYGIPVKKVWEEQTEKQLIRNKLGISSGKRVLVVSGGGEGLTPEKKIKKLLQKEQQPWEVYLFGGKVNEQKPCRQIINGGSVLVSKPFTSDYVDYVKAADLVISKPGGVSMAEAISSNVQVGIISPLPGQEKENRRVLASYNGVHIINRRTLLSDILNKPDNRPVFQKGRGNSRKQIVQVMIGQEVYTPAKAENGAEEFSEKYNDFPIG